MPAGPDARNPAREWLLALGAVLVFALVAAWLADDTWSDIRTSRLDGGWLTDFRDAIYYPALALREGVNPYDPSAFYSAYPVGQEFPLYSPVHLVVHMPLTLLSLARARAVYFGLNLGLIILLSATALRLARHQVTVASVFGFAALLLLSDPGFWDLRSGEPTLLVVLGVYLALACARERPGWGAVGLVLALTKPTFGVVLVLLMCCRRETRAALWGTLTAIAISAVVTLRLVDLAGGIAALIDSLRDDLEVTSRSPQSRLGSSLRIDAPNTLARLTRVRPGEAVATLAGLVLLAVGAWLVWRLHRHDPTGDRSELAILLAALLILVPFFHVPYDELLLAWPLALLLRRPLRDAPPWPRACRGTVTALLVVAMVGPTRWEGVNDALSRSVLARLAGPTIPGLCLLAALLLTSWTAWRASRADPERSPGIASTPHPLPSTGPG